jgi:FkbM family methyltransferase
VNSKRVVLAGRSFVVHGEAADRYFNEFVPDGGTFADAPIVVAGRYCRPDATIVDVGANIGLTALAFSAIAPRGHVIAIEPSPRNFALLQTNLERNDVRNVDAVNLAMSDRTGTVEMVEDDSFMAGNRIVAGGAGVSVPATTLDELLAGRGTRQVDLLKIDVEGHETQVLKGATTSLQRFQPMCVIEFNSYALVYHLGIPPIQFLNEIIALFPYVYVFRRTSYKVEPLGDRIDEFLKDNQAGGFVDDLVCTFTPLPAR